MHILYIEDEPNDAALVERFVRSTPHRLTVARNIADARQAMQLGPDMVLVDMMIGAARQGFDFVNEVRGSGFTKPIVAITGLSMPEDLEACYRSGCNHILNKPFMITDLAWVITRYGEQG